MRQYKTGSLVSEFKSVPFPSLTFPVGFLVFSIFTVALYETESINSREFNLWVTTGTAITSFYIALFYCVRAYFRYTQQTIFSTLKFMIFGLVCGFTKGIATAFVMNHLLNRDSFPYDEILIRGISGAGLGVTLAFVALLRGAYLTNLRSRLADFSKQNELTSQEIFHLGQEIDALKSEAQNELLKKTAETLKNATELELLSSNPEKNWKLISETLRIQLSEFARAQSHEIREFKKRLSVREILASIFTIKYFFIHVRVFVLIQFVASLSVSYSDDITVFKWTSLLFIHGLTSFFILNIADKFLKTTRANIRGKKLLTLFLTPLLLSSIFGLIDYLLLGNFYWGLQFVMFAWQLFLLCIISIVSQIIQSKEEEILQKSVIQTDLLDKQRILAQHHLQLRDELAKFLHGHLIFKILSTSSTLDKLAAEQDFDRYRIEVSSLIDDLNLNSFTQMRIEREINLEYFEKVKNQWDGMITISFLGQEHLDALTHRTQRVEIADVCEELISNAYRHGEATEISIICTVTSKTTFLIQATDNGHGIARGAQPGFGSNLFTLASDDNWRMIDLVGQGARVEIEIELYLPASRVDAATRGD